MNESHRSRMVLSLPSPLIIIVVINFLKYFYRFGPAYDRETLLSSETTFVSSSMHVTRARLLSVLRYPIMRNDKTKTRFRSIFIVSDVRDNRTCKEEKKNERETKVKSFRYWTR